ncbi:MAG: BON domain-containing protein [Rhodocyclaceae bacterium]|nr:BON domain-containing protein [Rhodocyclaceae bacterium]
MKKTAIAIALTTTLFAGAAATVALANDSAENRKSDPGAITQFVNDSALTGKVKAALAADPVTDAIEIEVETARRVVLLEGEVDSAKEKAQAEKVARSVEGVEGVMNKLIVVGSGDGEEKSAVGQFVSDTVVTTKVKTALAADTTTEAIEIEVETTRGVVSLRGEVDSEAESKQAEKLALGIEGVREVDNELIVAKDADGKDKGAVTRYINDAALTAKVKTALAADSVTEAFEIDVETTRGVVLLSGQVDSEKELTQAQKVASAIDGVREVMNRLTVRTN